MIVCHPSSSLIVRRRPPVVTSDGQRRSVTIIDQLRQMVTGYVRQRPPWPSSSAVIDKVHPSSSLIRTTTISRASAVVQQAPRWITSSAAHTVIRHRGRSSFDSGHHGAHPSRRRCCAVTTAACAELLCRVLFPALREAGAGNKTRWW